MITGRDPAFTYIVIPNESHSVEEDQLLFGGPCAASRSFQLLSETSGNLMPILLQSDQQFANSILVLEVSAAEAVSGSTLLADLCSQGVLNSGVWLIPSNLSFDSESLSWRVESTFLKRQQEVVEP